MISANWPNRITSASVMMFGLLALIAPTGYSWGPVLLVLASVFTFVIPSYRPNWPSSDYVPLATILILIFVAAATEILWHGLSSRSFDRPSRFIFALFVIPLLAHYPPKAQYLWLGFAVGAVGAGGWAIHQVFFEGMSRAQGETQAIQFGNIAMLMGLISLVGFLWFQQLTRPNNFLKILMLAGFAGGITASFLSGSRGGWLALPVGLVLTLYTYKFQLSAARSIGLIALSIAVIAALSMAPDTGVQKRLDRVFYETKEYFTEADATTSIGARLEMWKAAAKLGYQRPFLGWGSIQVEIEKAKLAEAGRIDSAILKYGHAHNDFLDSWQKRGLLGLGALIALYFVPLFFFMKKLTDGRPKTRPMALAGALMCTSYIIFSLSQAFFEHNSGVMVYAFLLVTLWALCVESEKDDEQPSPDQAK
ncbi:O-antigen ligase family protein [Marinobacter sp. KM021]|uniref:O-antigen ligase family protein n=1 Tax=Marinobacter sp. KM021 TaxID=3075616 RepID=UPI003D6B603D